MPFVLNLVLPTFDYFSSIFHLQSRYGFKDAFNLGLTASASAVIPRTNATIPASGWFAPDRDWNRQRDYCVDD
ncbi:MAG: hypothetical protein MZU97_00510 [Bacillus subtilis]|nr:hypothetical protein [Bacillus subtilis]